MSKYLHFWNLCVFSIEDRRNGDCNLDIHSLLFHHICWGGTDRALNMCQSLVCMDLISGRDPALLGRDRRKFSLLITTSLIHFDCIWILAWFWNFFRCIGVTYYRQQLWRTNYTIIWKQNFFRSNKPFHKGSKGRKCVFLESALNKDVTYFPHIAERERKKCIADGQETAVLHMP